MWQYVLLTLRRQRGRGILASGGFLLAACALILLSATTQTTVLTSHQIISQNWRSTYDLVVLPAQSQLHSQSLVPADQFESFNGGISIQQYEQIKHISGIAVAAPLAVIGYASYPSSEAEFPTHPLASGFYQFQWTLTAFNGQQNITEYHSSLYVFVSSTELPAKLLDDNPVTDQLLNKLGIDQAYNPKWGPFGVSMPNEGSYLLTAIDPQAEDQLIHLNSSVLGGQMLPEQTTLQHNKIFPSLPLNQNETLPNYNVPMLLNAQLPGKTQLHFTFYRLVTDATTLPQIVKRGGQSYLAHLPEQQLFAGDAPTAQNAPQLFAPQTILVWNGHSWQTGKNPYVLPAGQPLYLSATPSGLTYQPTPKLPGATGTDYTLTPSSTQFVAGSAFGSYIPYDNLNLTGKEVAFRDLNAFPEIGIGSNYYHDYNNAIYTIQPVGTFAGVHVAAQFSDALNWLPENTYTAPPTVLKYDAQGHPIKPTTLLPTANPAGFLLQPPLALTTLAAAQRIEGNNCISAIRIRISGNVAPGEAGWKQVTQIAQTIHKLTGLQAIVTLGSSPSPVLVYIPGLTQGQDGVLQNIAPIGWAEERWITIGVALVYLNQLGETQLLLLGAVLLVCLGYLVVTMSSLVSAQRRELAVLSALGWRPWHPAGMFLAQALALSLCGGVVGIGLALLLVALIGASPPWQIVVWTMPGVLGLALLSALYPLWTIWRIQPAEVLRAGTTVTKESTTSRLNRWNAAFWSRLPAVGGMALRNLSRSRGRAIIAIGSLFLSAVLLTVMVDGILAFRQTLQGTLLGDYVLLQTAVPQIAGAVFAILLTFLSVADLLLLQVRERQKEIGLLQAVGWRAKIVQRLFVQEGLTLAVIGAVPGVLVALGVLMTQHAAQGAVPAPLVGLGAVILMLLVAWLATIPAVRAVNRLPMMDVLRAE